MAQKASFTTGDPINVMCFDFKNPESVNEPSGNFMLWVDGSNVQGQMTISEIFALGATTYLNLTGTLSGTNPILCTLQGVGVTLAPGQPAASVNTPVNLSFASDWSTGQFTSLGDLPVQKVDCQGA